ncbi:hypothetical protein Tco_0295601, partial [Tanacetum coccineum]
YVPGPEHPPSPVEVPYVPEPEGGGALALADSPAAPVIDPVPSAEDTQAFETDEVAPTHVPSPRRHTDRMSVRPQTPVPFPSEVEVERLLALPIPPPSPLTLLSSPLPQIPSPPPPSSLHLPPPIPISLPLPLYLIPLILASLFIILVDRREDTSEAELPPRKRLCLTALTSRYEVEESSTAVPRPTRGHGADYGFIGTVDAEVRRQRAKEVGYGIRDVWVDPVETVEEGQLSAALWQIQALQARDQTHAGDREGAASTTNNMPPKRTSAAARADDATAAAAPMTAAAVEQLIEARVSAALANHETLRNRINGHGDGYRRSGCVSTMV